jgi:hypothetical protein
LQINFKYESQFFASVSVMAEELINSFAKTGESVFFALAGTLITVSIVSKPKSN